jgi:hypothetical protein
MLTARFRLPTISASLLFALSLPIAIRSAESPNQVKFLECGQSKVKVLTIHEPEGQRVQVALFDLSGKERYPDLMWSGEFVPLCGTGSFVLLDTNVHHGPGLSFLMDSTPRVIARFEFGELSNSYD